MGLVQSSHPIRKEEGLGGCGAYAASGTGACPSASQGVVSACTHTHSGCVWMAHCTWELSKVLGTPGERQAVDGKWVISQHTLQRVMRA